MLVNSKGQEVFKGKTRHEIDAIVKHQQAEALAPLKEILEVNNKYKLEQIAHFK